MTESSRADVVAGYLAAFAIFVAAVSIVYRPVRLGVVAILIAMVAAAMAGARSARLAEFAVFATAVGWFAGMVAAIATDNQLW